MRENYAQHGGSYCRQALGRTAHAVNLMASKLGLKTTVNSGHFKNGECRYPTPKGSRRSPATEFKKGRAVEKRPVGEPYWMAKEGYMIKRARGAKPIPYHRHLWQQAHGPIPSGYIVRFIDGDRANCSLDNLRCISRKEHNRLNTEAMTPETRQQRARKIWRSRDRNMRQRLGLPDQPSTNR